MSLINFDATQIAPDTGVMDAIPAGWYNVAADASEMKPTKDGSGAYLEVRFAVLDGQYKDRKLFARFNLQNSNPQAVEIARRQLSAVCHAVGLLQVQDSQQLHGRPLKVKVKVRPADGQYEASNDINAYRNINDQSMGNGAAPQAAMPPAAPPAQGFAATPYGGAPAANMPPAAAPQQQWQQPQAQQPWQQPGQGAPAQQFQQPQANPAQFQQPTQQPPQQQFQQPQGAPAGGAVPPWMQPAQ